jgi:hypothetical protein
LRVTVEFLPDGPRVSSQVYADPQVSETEARSAASDLLSDYAEKCERAAWHLASPADPMNSRFD